MVQLSALQLFCPVTQQTVNRSSDSYIGQDKCRRCKCHDKLCQVKCEKCGIIPYSTNSKHAKEYNHKIVREPDAESPQKRKITFEPDDSDENDESPKKISRDTNALDVKSPTTPINKFPILSSPPKTIQLHPTFTPLTIPNPPSRYLIYQRDILSAADASWMTKPHAYLLCVMIADPKLYQDSELCQVMNKVRECVSNNNLQQWLNQGSDMVTKMFKNKNVKML